MIDNLHEWANLAVRWFHLIAGISWIGSSFYFMWLDSALEAPEKVSGKKKEDVEGELWMVHSGGFYLVEKKLIKPGQVPKSLHWFKWEATFTWISGIFLLGIVYYMTGGMYLLDPAISKITNGQAILLSISTLTLGWFVYDILWRSKLAKEKEPIALAISYALLIGLSYFYCHVLSGRAAFIHIGALFGTMMVLNVWVHILPNQQQMIDATQAGRVPDYNLGKIAKRRSVHNSYMTFPVLFIMISNHYPATFSHAQNWIVLLLMIVLGAGVRHTMISKSKNAKLTLIPVGLVLAVLIYMTGPKSLAHHHGSEPVKYMQAQAIIQNRCIQCHSAHATDDVFKVAPNGITFDTPEQIRQHAPRILVRAAQLKNMPLANKTGMTDEERSALAHWIESGADISN